MLDFINNINLENGRYVIALQIFVVVFLTVLANFIIKRVIDGIEKRAKKTNNVWDDAVVYAMRKPARLLIWTVGLTMAMDIAFSIYNTKIITYIQPIREIGTIFAITWFSLRFIKILEKDVTQQDSTTIKLDATTAGAIAKLLRVSIFITTALIAMQTLGFSISGVLAFGGIGGMAVALAAKDMLANFFGALMIYFDKPFKVGDWIRSPDKEIEGTVEDIGWRRTLVRTFDKRPIYIPNALFTTITVENPSRMQNRRIYEYFGLRYDDMKQVDNITQAVENMLRQHEEIDTNQTLMVHLDRFSDSSVDFFVYTFTKTTQWIKFHGIKQDIMLKIAKIIEDNGAEIAFPTHTLYMSEPPAIQKI